MKILIDTNIIIDYLADRMPFAVFEDALVSVCAKRVKAEYIVTRNSNDFVRSDVPTVSPEDFLDKFFPD